LVDVHMAHRAMLLERYLGEIGALMKKAVHHLRRKRQLDLGFVLPGTAHCAFGWLTSSWGALCAALLKPPSEPAGPLPTSLSCCKLLSSWICFVN
jgi:hypothetical protein